MDNEAINTATLVAAVGAGTVGGVFFAFSTFVMRALDRLPAADAISAMQAINVTVVNPLFMGALFGTGAVCVGLAVHGVRQWGSASSTLLVVGSAVYLVGELAVTVAFHVPRNDALDRVDPHGADAAATWHRFLVEWTAGNHVRTLAGLGAAACFAAALRLL